MLVRLLLAAESLLPRWTFLLSGLGSDLAVLRR